jgi:hypothetical protein
MASPHRNDPHGGIAPHPDDREKLAVKHRGRFPPFLVVARSRLVNDRPSVKELKGVRKIEVPLLQRSLALVLVPFKVHGGSLSFVSTLCKYIVYPQTHRLVDFDKSADVEPFILHMYAALAEKARAMISARTNPPRRWQGQGTRLGNPQIAATQAKGTARTKAAAEQFAPNVLPFILPLRAQRAYTSRTARTGRSNGPSGNRARS